MASTSYLVRVVLHRTDGSDDYTDLHSEMSKLGFSQTVEGSISKELYKLPGGMYYFDCNKPLNRLKAGYSTTDEVYTKVVAAVAVVMSDEALYIKDSNTPATVMVSATDDMVWSGLKKQRKLLPRRP